MKLKMVSLKNFSTELSENFPIVVLVEGNEFESDVDGSITNKTVKNQNII